MQVSYRSTLYIIQRKVSKDKVKGTLSVMLGSRHLVEDRKLYWLKENDLFLFENEEKKDQQQQFIIAFSDLLALRYGTRSLSRKTTKDSEF